MCLCSVDSFLEAFSVRSGLKWQSKLLLASTLWAARFSIKGIVLISANRYTLHIIVSEYLGAHPIPFIVTVVQHVTAVNISCLQTVGW